jgi:hypothetical protein
VAQARIAAVKLSSRQPGLVTMLTVTARAVLGVILTAIPTVIQIMIQITHLDKLHIGYQNKTLHYG